MLDQWRFACMSSSIDRPEERGREPRSKAPYICTIAYMHACMTLLLQWWHGGSIVVVSVSCMYTTPIMMIYCELPRYHYNIIWVECRGAVRMHAACYGYECVVSDEWWDSLLAYCNCHLLQLPLQLQHYYYVSYISYHITSYHITTQVQEDTRSIMHVCNVRITRITW